MTYLIVLAVCVLILQLFIFFYLRRKNRHMRETDILLKYDIKTRKDAWHKLQDPDLPEDDRKKLQEIYSAED